jgi:hypothetical protein
MFAGIQRQIDDLSGQLQALTDLVHIQTDTARREPTGSTKQRAAGQAEADDG